MDICAGVDNYKVGLARQAGKIDRNYDNWHLWRDFRKYCAVQGYKLEWDRDGNYHYLILYDVDEGTENFIKITFDHASLFNFHTRK